jgi:hypothetical protein
MDDKLTEKENKLIKRIYKNHEISPYAYVVIGLLTCISILGVIIGIQFRSKDGFLMAIYFGTVSFGLFLKIKNDSMIVRILEKLQLRKQGENNSEHNKME